MELCWGDVGLLLSMPRQGLGNSAIAAVADAEQAERYDGLWAGMAITEPEAGSDSAAIRTTAELDGDEYVLNGEKIYVTSGERADVLVVWATLDRDAGRAAIKSFVVYRDNPGLKLDRLEHKLGIRASDTAAFILDDCRVPKEDLLGSPEIDMQKSFGGAMKTFDNTRPLVAGMAVGVARACIEETEKHLEAAGVAVDYDRPAIDPVGGGRGAAGAAGRLRGGAAADHAGRVDGRQLQAQLGRGVAVQGQGRPLGHRHRAALREAVRRAGPDRERAAREVGPRREDPGPVRGHAADPAADHRPRAAGQELLGAEVAVGNLSGTASEVVDAPLAEVWAVVEDTETAPEWQHGMDRMEVLERDAQGRPEVVQTETDASVRTVKSKVRFSYDGPTRLSWEQIKGDLKHVVGSWDLEDLGDGRTRVTYTLDGDPGRMLGMLVRGPVEGQIRKVLVDARPGELKARVEGAG